MCSFLCCPLVGAVAIWHALRVAPMWRQNDRRSAYMHAVKVNDTDNVLSVSSTQLLAKDHINNDEHQHISL